MKPSPSESDQQIIPNPEPSQDAYQESVDLGSVLTPELVEELAAPITAAVSRNQKPGNNFEETGSGTDGLIAPPVPLEKDEILQQPTNLRQAAQAIVVPVQNKQTPWSSSSLFAGLIGLGLFALIAGLIVARRGVPGAIAS
jgi:hypothetical protein